MDYRTVCYTARKATEAPPEKGNADRWVRFRHLFCALTFNVLVSVFSHWLTRDSPMGTGVFAVNEKVSDCTVEKVAGSHVPISLCTFK